MGIVITKKWSATLVNTRDTHRDLNNEEVPFDEPFNLSDRDVLEYPGDPKGRAENIINCHCVMITDVVVKGTKQEDIITANDTAGELLGHYKAIEPKTTDDLQEACNKYGGKLAGLEYKLKSKHSLRRKILSDTAEKGKSIPLVAKEINDVLRYTMVYDEDKLTQAYFDTIDLLKKKQYNVIKVKNTFVKGKPYKGINMILANNKGDNFELQFHTPYSLEVKEKKLHKLYEEQRKLDSVIDKLEWDKLTEEMIKISDTIVHPINVDRIK